MIKVGELCPSRGLDLRHTPHCCCHRYCSPSAVTRHAVSAQVRGCIVGSSGTPRTAVERQPVLARLRSRRCLSRDVDQQEHEEEEQQPQQSHDRCFSLLLAGLTLQSRCEQKQSTCAGGNGMGEQPRKPTVASKPSVTCKEALCLVFLGSKSLDTLQTPSQRLKASIFVAISWCQLPRTVRQCTALQRATVCSVLVLVVVLSGCVQSGG